MHVYITKGIKLTNFHVMTLVLIWSFRTLQHITLTEAPYSLILVDSSSTASLKKVKLLTAHFSKKIRRTEQDIRGTMTKAERNVARQTWKLRGGDGR